MKTQPVFYPNARASLSFSGKRDVMRNVGASPSPTKQVQFGALPLYKGPYNNIIFVTDFNDQTSNARAYQHFQNVQRFVTQHRPVSIFNPYGRLVKLLGYIRQNQSKSYASKSFLNRFRENWGLYKRYRQETAQLKNYAWDTSSAWRKSNAGVLGHTTIEDIPLFNIDYAAQSLFELTRKTTNQNVYVHVTDPGVGSGHAGHKRSILVTEKYGTHIAPNSGIYGLLTQFLDHRNEPYDVMEIDSERVEQLSSLVPNTEKDDGKTFEGRDVFAVAAGAVIGGLKPEALATPESVQKSLEPVISPYGKVRSLPKKVGESVEVFANRDNTSDNLVLNADLSRDELNTLLEENAQFKLSTQDKDNELLLPLKETFGQVKTGGLLIYKGSKASPKPGRHFLEVAINGGKAAEALRLESKNKAVKLKLERIS